MEPWDGPASVAFTDGTRDRRRARPQRPAPQPLLGHRRRPRHHGQRGRRARHRPGQGRQQGPPAARAGCSSSTPPRGASSTTRRSRRRSPPSTRTASGSAAGIVELADLPEREHVVFSHDSVLRRQQVFGYTHEELKIIIAPMAQTGAEPIGSMGTDTPIAVLSDRPRLLFDYFQQLFAQVTNPPLDAIREEVVTAVGSTIGPEVEPARARRRRAAASWRCRSRSSTTTSWPRSSTSTTTGPSTRRRPVARRCVVVSGLYRVAGGGLALRRALDAIRHEVSRAIDDGARIIVLSDRNADAVYAPIPSLLLTARGAPPPDPREAAHQGRAGRRVRRRPRGAPHGAADRLRRRGDQPVPGVRVDRET